MQENKSKINFDDINKSKQYWENILGNDYEKVSFKERATIKNNIRENKELNIDDELTKELIRISKNDDLIIYVLLLTVFKITVSKYSRFSNFLIGIPQYFKSEQQNYNNEFLVIDNNVKEDNEFKDELINNRKNLLEVYNNQLYPLKNLIKIMDIQDKVNIYFTMKNIHSEKQIQDILRQPNNELTVVIEKNQHNIKLKFNNYKDSIEEEINIITKMFINLLNQALKNLTCKIKDLDAVGEEEKYRLLYEFNNKCSEYPKNKTIQELFEDQVVKTPDNVAVIYEDKELTYRQLNEKSNSLARLLRKRGVKPNNMVGIITENSLEMVIGMMGILKAGGAYLPISPEYPQERINYMCEDSNIEFILTQSKLLKSISIDTIVIDLDDSETYIESNADLEKINTSKDLAYVIYTSGSTGKPKGVMVEHESACITLQWRKGEYKFESSDNVIQLFSNAFDGFVTSFYTPLISGSRIIVLNNNDMKDVMAITEKIKEYKITHFITIPYMASAIMDNIGPEGTKYLKGITLAGDTLTEKVVYKCKKNKESIEVINEYGPTENTVVSTIKRNINKNEKITIGKPRDNTKVYILDKNNRLQPIGVAGELCVSGDGLAKGYLNKPELTAEKFIDNPFEPGKRMYKTGDLAVWLPDGNIDFLGRIDNQVKVSGFRIELGEIESKILENEYINEAIVMVNKDSNNEKYICAYVVSQKSLDELNIKNFLKEKLPEYMIPNYFIQLENIPLTPNGKIDRKAIEKIKLAPSIAEYEAPRNEVEIALQSIWKDVLGVDEIGINDNFFSLGGQSLKATVLIAKIHKELDREITLKELFNMPTIKEISKFIQDMKPNNYCKIDRIEEKGYYEASAAQKRMYMLQQLDNKSIAYNIPIIFELEGVVNREKIENIFNELVLRHEALRTYFKVIEGEIVQVIDKENKFKLIDRKCEDDIEDIISKFILPFELDKGPLFRVELVESKGKKYLLIDAHHSISDGVSMGILTREFIALYNNENLDPLNLQYKDFAAWQNNFLKTEEMKNQQEYWINNFNDEVPVLNMPTDYERTSIQSFEGDSISFDISEKLTKALKEITKETGTTMHMVLLSAFNILLSKYSGQEDIVVGIPTSGRTHAELQNVMGMFVNTLALRNKPEGSKTYIEFLKEVKENSLQAYENQNYQLESLIENIDVRRDTSRNPLFDVMFNIADTGIDNIGKLDGLLLKAYDSGRKISKFDLTLNAMEYEEKLNFSIEYCSKLFKKETIERLSKHFIGILETISNNIKILLSDVELLSDEERVQILDIFNDTNTDYLRDKVIQEIFEEQVEKTPNNIAVVFEDEKITYKELNEKANRVAVVLRNKGVKSDSIVGLMVERSIEMVVGIIGILKSGGAYLPIDPNQPKKRIEYILNDSGSEFLLSTKTLVDDIAFQGEFIDLFNKNIFKNDSNNLQKINDAGSLAYVIYTSGTTGNPKGVMIEHKNLNNLIIGLNKNIYERYDGNLKVALVSPYYFDASVKQIFASLLNGHSLYIVNDYVRRDGSKLLKYYEDNKIQVTDGTPMHIKMMINADAFKENKLEVQHYIIGGEALTLNTIKEFYKYAKKGEGPYISNVYGPTECCVDSSIYLINSETVDNLTTIPIGRPMTNYKLYVVDKYNKEVPIGITGELCISGEGVARGYLNNPKLTEEKFINNPFALGSKMYKTGDLVRWMSDGNIEFLGRIDNQVKIRGFRIELDEIENRILQHEHIKEAAVVVKETKEKDNYICAYLVSEIDVNELNLKDYLKESLPEYMIPAYFIKIEKMPITANGKLDRKSLPEPKIECKLNEYEAPKSQVEKIISKIFSDTLGIEKVGVNDNFFELGGHSLRAMTLISKIHKELDREISLKEVFKAPTVRGLSIVVEDLKESHYSNITKIEEKEYYEASSAQKRMYMINEFEKESIAYNMPQIFEIEGEVNFSKIEKVFNELVLRHEVLRTYFETVESEIVQKIDNFYEFRLLEKETNEDISDVVNNFIRPFQLNKAPLFRVEIVRCKEKNYLLIDMHHIISDGVSMGILTKEFVKLYNGENLVPLRIQYKDFAEWQNKFLKSKEMKDQEEYWIDMFKGEIPILNLPYDYERPSIQSFEGSSMTFDIDKKLTVDVRALAKKTETTLHMVVLSVFNILLSKYSGQEDIVIGVPIAGRVNSDLQNIMGVFVNTLSLRNKPQGNKKYIDFLNEVRENSLKSYENQSYQIEVLAEKLELKRDLSRNLLFDVMFNTLNMDNNNIELEGLILKPYSNENKTAKFDLTLSLMECEDYLKLTLTYCSRLFAKDTIEIMRDDFIEILKMVINDNNLLLKDIVNKEMDKEVNEGIDLVELEDDFLFE